MANTWTQRYNLECESDTAINGFKSIYLFFGFSSFIVNSFVSDSFGRMAGLEFSFFLTFLIFATPFLDWIPLNCMILGSALGSSNNQVFLICGFISESNDSKSQLSNFASLVLYLSYGLGCTLSSFILNLFPDLWTIYGICFVIMITGVPFVLFNLVETPIFLFHKFKVKEFFKSM